MHSLKQLLAEWQSAVVNTNLPAPPLYFGPDVQISRITEKSSEVQPGTCFVARVRVTSDGHSYIGQAIERGASMILAQRSAAELHLSPPSEMVYLQVTDTAVALAWLAAAWEGFPSRQLITIGITGTDGKTSTANILYEIMKTSGIRVGLLSTIRAVIGDTQEPLELHVTTPEAPVIQRHLRRMVDSGLTHCILEVTSHGLAQHRVAAVDFDIAAITNITHEHLDYHGDFEGYYAAKSRLFETLLTAEWGRQLGASVKAGFIKTAVLNRDDQSYVRLHQIPVPRQVDYGITAAAMVYATKIHYAADETRFRLNFNLSGPDSPPAGSISVSSTLVGQFNIYNMLAAAAIALRLDVKPGAIKAGLHSIRAIEGRLQRIDRGQPFLTIVDFAHTPNALEKAIGVARHMTQGRIITVFGSAGKRDVEKRRLMAEASAQYADLTVLTAEDPRTESLDEILEMMAAGCRRHGGIEGKTFWRVPDRGKAIYFALTLAQPQDLVLVCGKGHEQSMCFGTVEYPWDDREATGAALDALLRQRSMPDLGLPTFDNS
jgi:UDP-N-acetylmuramoyl-L-alanyl-D-glutamate--2,6-diaminopimelate ligase